MAIDLRMPALTPTMEVGALAEWLVKPGDTVEAGQVIAEIETDKSVLEFEAIQAGVIGEILVAAGTQEVKVDAVIATLLEPGEDASAQSAPATPAEVAAPAAARGDHKPVEVSRTDGRVKASPSARRLAREAGVDIATLTGTGPRGRIVAADVRAATESAAAPVAVASSELPAGEFEDVEQTVLQKTMARRMAESKATVPHLYAAIDIHVDELLARRKALKSAGGSATLNDYVVRAVALALRDTPDMNVQYLDGVVRRFRDADVAVAVAGDGGLVTPIVRAANTRSVNQISAEISELAALAGKKRLRPEQYEGGTFTVSNVGMFGVTQSWPIINTPQAGILGVGRAEPTPVVDDGALRLSTVMKVTLAADHRCIDGGIVGAFLGSLKGYLEQPERL